MAQNDTTGLTLPQLDANSLDLELRSSQAFVVGDVLMQKRPSLLSARAAFAYLYLVVCAVYVVPDTCQASFNREFMSWA